MTIPSVAPGDIVRVKNDGEKLLKLKWDSRTYEVPPGGEEVMPFDCAKLYFGDPRAIDRMLSLSDNRGVVSFLPDRLTEVRRLRLLWLHGFGEYTGEDDEVAFDEHIIPHVRVSTIRGEEIPTVLQDPQGIHVVPSKVSKAENSALMDVVKRQGQMIEVLMARLGMEPGGSPLAAVDAPEVEPSPTMVLDPDSDEVTTKEAAVLKRTGKEKPKTVSELPEDSL